MSVMIPLMEKLFDWLSPRQRMQKKLLAKGREAQAELVASQDTLTYQGNPGMSTARQWELQVRVRPPAGAEFDATMKEYFKMRTQPVVGSVFPVLFDPQRTDRLMIDTRKGGQIPTTEFNDPTVRVGMTIDLRNPPPSPEVPAEG